MKETQPNQYIEINRLDLPSNENKRLKLLIEEIELLLQRKTRVAGRSGNGRAAHEHKVRQPETANETASRVCAQVVTDLVRGGFSLNTIKQIALAEITGNDYLITAVDTEVCFSKLLASSPGRESSKDRETVFVIVAPTPVAGEMDMWVVGQKGEGQTLLPEDTQVGSLHVRFNNELRKKTPPYDLGEFSKIGMKLLESKTDIYRPAGSEYVDRLPEEIPLPDGMEEVISKMRETYPYKKVTASN